MARLAAIALLGLALAPATAGAVTHVADFEAIPAGTQVTNEYRAATGLYFDPVDPAFLPLVQNVGAEAQSGAKVGRILNCDVETCGEGASSRTRGRFDTTVSTVTVYVGFVAPGSPGTSVTLEAYDGGGALLGSSTVTPGAGIK